MSKVPVKPSDVNPDHMAEPTKYIVRCCEARKMRQVKSAAVGSRRVRMSSES